VVVGAGGGGAVVVGVAGVVVLVMTDGVGSSTRPVNRTTAPAIAANKSTTPAVMMAIGVRYQGTGVAWRASSSSGASNAIWGRGPSATGTPP
jgi:hypothetical protein